MLPILVLSSQLKHNLPLPFKQSYKSFWRQIKRWGVECKLYVGMRLRWSRGSLLAFGTQVRGFTPCRTRRIFLGRKNPQHAFLRRGSKAVGPMP